MAEFSEVMRQWKRLCMAMERIDPYSCEGCPCHKENYCNEIFEMPCDTNWVALEKIIMNWAVEHPELTWKKFLEKFGFLKKEIDENGNIKTHYDWDKFVPIEVIEKLDPIDLYESSIDTIKNF